MEKTDTIILSPEELAAYMAESTISVTSTYEHSPVVLMVDDTVIGTLGNFSASIGKAKSKKTFNVSAIVASALSGSTVLHYRSMFPENKRKILYIDTEQGRYHCQLVLKRILRLADLPEYKNPDNLIMLALRKFSPKLRLAIVEQAIGTIPDLGLHFGMDVFRVHLIFIGLKPKICCFPVLFLPLMVLALLLRIVDRPVIVVLDQ